MNRSTLTNETASLGGEDIREESRDSRDIVSAYYADSKESAKRIRERAVTLVSLMTHVDGLSRMNSPRSSVEVVILRQTVISVP